MNILCNAVDSCNSFIADIELLQTDVSTTIDCINPSITTNYNDAACGESNFYIYSKQMYDENKHIVNTNCYQWDCWSIYLNLTNIAAVSVVCTAPCLYIFYVRFYECKDRNIQIPVMRWI